MTAALIDQSISNADMDEIANFWLLLAVAAAVGDVEADALFHGTFGPWASELFRSRAH